MREVGLKGKPWSPPNRRWKEADAREMLAVMQGEGETEERFAARYGLDPKRVRRWRERLDGQGQGAKRWAFAPVRVVEGVEERDPSIEIRIGRVTIRVGRQFDAGLLARVIAALEENAC